MQHIPAEIINEIFKHLILNILRVHKPREFPWNAGQICASWRDVFKSTPWIWRKFVIDLCRIKDHNLDNAICLVKLCIQRSRNQPLSFFIFNTREYDWPPRGGQYVNHILSYLIVESQRWEAIAVEADPRFLEAFCPPNLSNHFPLLRSMTLQTKGWSLSELKCQESLLHAQNLTRIQLPAYDFDWSRLTVLTVRRVTRVADVLSVIRRLRCIEKLHLKIIQYPITADEERDSMIALPTLKVLSCPGDVLCHLRAPALEELHLRMQSVEIIPAPLPDGIFSFLRTSSGSLTRLILGRRCCLDSDIKRILQEVPNVTKLCLIACLDLSDVLPYNPERTPILPKLELLIADYLNWYQNALDVETLCATVASRTSKPSMFAYGAGKLKELRVVRDIRSYSDTSHLRLLCEEREVKYLALERSDHFERSKMEDHRWCTGVENCAFDLCNNNALFWLETESL